MAYCALERRITCIEPADWCWEECVVCVWGGGGGGVLQGDETETKGE